jgi:hypothetical protein
MQLLRGCRHLPRRIIKIALHQEVAVDRYAAVFQRKRECSCQACRKKVAAKVNENFAISKRRWEADKKNLCFFVPNGASQREGFWQKCGLFSQK